MFIRILSAIILLPLLFFVLIHGGIPFYLGVSLVSLMAIREFYDVFKQKNLKPASILGYIATLFISIFLFLEIKAIYLEVVLFILFFLACILVVLRKYNIMDVGITFFGIIYIPYFLNHVTLVRTSFDHKYVWLVFIIAWMTDTFAYFSGYFFGKHKLIPEISPKKTIEGSIGGIVGSIFSCVVFAYIFDFSLIHMSIVGGLGSIIAQIGDLFASAIKRFLGIKDYGKLIPGHGGILDRFDSIIFTAPFVYYYLLIFVK